MEADIQNIQATGSSGAAIAPPTGRATPTDATTGMANRACKRSRTEKCEVGRAGHGSE